MNDIVSLMKNDTCLLLKDADDLIHTVWIGSYCISEAPLQYSPDYTQANTYVLTVEQWIQMYRYMFLST